MGSRPFLVPVSALFLLVDSVSALDFSNIDTKYYYIIGGVAAAVLILIIGICCCCCCCKKKKSQPHIYPQNSEVPEIKTSGSRAVPKPPGPSNDLLSRADSYSAPTPFTRTDSPPATAPLTRTDSQRATAPLPRTDSQRATVPLTRTDSQRVTRIDSERITLPVVRTDSDRRLTTDAEHRRRLDAILATQASAVVRELGHAGSSRDQSGSGRPDKEMSGGNPGHVPLLEHQSSSRQLGPTTPPASTTRQTDSHDRVTFPSSSDSYRTTYDFLIEQNNDSVMASFQRIPPNSATEQGQRSKKILPLPTQTEDPPEFMGIKLKPIVVNKAGGTYIPPEDF